MSLPNRIWPDQPVLKKSIIVQANRVKWWGRKRIFPNPLARIKHGVYGYRFSNSSYSSWLTTIKRIKTRVSDTPIGVNWRMIALGISQTYSVFVPLHYPCPFPLFSHIFDPWCELTAAEHLKVCIHNSKRKRDMNKVFPFNHCQKYLGNQLFDKFGGKLVYYASGKAKRGWGDAAQEVRRSRCDAFLVTRPYTRLSQSRAVGQGQ